jgi:FkbM family methyltransferase
MSVSIEERKATLEIFNYLGKNPVVFDVGCNKGEWLETISTHVSEVHAFEPNKLLLHYCIVKFIGQDHIKFNEEAVYSRSGEALDFFYFTNENNGLSSVYHNKKWDYLPMQRGKVQSITIDDYCKRNDVEYIDLMKIDVEGAEPNVLSGAEGMISHKKVKVIQIEYNDTYKLTDTTFTSLIKWFDQRGYNAFSFDGENFIQIFDTDFIEDYRLENFYFMDAEITQDWNGEFKKNTRGIPKFEFALEIGCFEGLTTRYICDNLLKPGGRIICVDPLTDEYLPGHEDNHLFVGQYDRFIRNTKNYPVELLRKTSFEAWGELKDYRFDFIYIDGDHRKASVYKDGINAYKLCKSGGHILFDDYGWREETKQGIDMFLDSVKGYAEVLIKDYQVLVKKV